MHKEKEGNWCSSIYCWTHGVGFHDVEKCFRKSEGNKDKAIHLNRMSGIKRGIQEEAQQLGSYSVTNIIQHLIINNNTKVSEYLIQNNNECNNFRWNPPTNNPMYGISDTGAIEKYTKVETPCVNKVKIMQGPRVILPDESLM